MEIKPDIDHTTALAGADSQAQTPAISHLQRREIQAPVAACLIHGFIDALGEEEAFFDSRWNSGLKVARTF